MTQIFLQKALELKPTLINEKVMPLESTLPDKDHLWAPDESFILDFGTHIVGRFHIKVVPNQTPDSPLRIDISLGETMDDLDIQDYKGSLSSSWIQKQSLYFDVVPEEIVFERRYAFRYVKVSFPATTAYRVRVEQAFAISETSADYKNVPDLPKDIDPELEAIDTVALRTLRDCMQHVFEDGPKRDRRLWLGDLFLQAKANFYTFKNLDLVKRCLYLFAGLPHENGILSSGVYQEPVLKNQSWIIHDYALFFTEVLYDCYEFSGDKEFLEELWPVAFTQCRIAMEHLDNNNLIQPRNYFIDWCDPLSKVAAGQGILIAMLKRAKDIALILNEKDQISWLDDAIKTTTDAALTLFDSEIGLFVSGPDRQVSRASQMWMIIAGVFSKEQNSKIIDNLLNYPQVIATVTPYAMHFYIQSMIDSGRKDLALTTMKEYWGGMVSKGADCFWEVYVPDQPLASPYRDFRANSFCHAWSCTPTYFIRKYFI